MVVQLKANQVCDITEPAWWVYQYLIITSQALPVKNAATQAAQPKNIGDKSTTHTVQSQSQQACQ